VFKALHSNEASFNIKNMLHVEGLNYNLDKLFKECRRRISHLGKAIWCSKSIN